MAVDNSKLHTLVVTTEHAATGKMGGIGSYNAETGRLSRGTLFLLVDDAITLEPSDLIIICHRYIEDNLPGLMASYNNIETRDLVILEVVLDILVKHPGIGNVATHEYAGIGSRIAEAARTGVLASHVKVRTHCHGGHIQLERATGSWLGNYLDTLNAERSSIENADEVWFAGKYLHNLYAASGIRIDEDKVKFLGLPYHLSDVDGVDYTGIDTIAFIGRMNKLKGYDIFTEVIEHILSEGGDHRGIINHVVAIGNDDNSMPDMRLRIERCTAEAGVTYRQELMTRDDTLSYIRKNAGKTLFLLPYFSDNYSVAMLEIIDAGAPLLVLDTGGNNELINNKLWFDNRIARTKTELIDLTEKYLDMSAGNRKKECMLLKNAFVKEQTVRNERYEKLFSSSRWKRKPSSPQTNTSIEYLYIDEKDRLADGWISLSSATGEVYSSHSTSTNTTHVFLSISDIKYDFKLLEQTLNNAVQSSGDKCVFSVAYSDPSGPHSIRNGSLGQFVYRPQNLLLTNICMPIDLYKGFINRYRNRVCAYRSGAEFMLSALLYILYAQNIRILPIPLVAGTSDRVIVSTLDYDEAIFSDFAHFQEHPEWEAYRYTAILRYDRSREDNVGDKVLKYDYLLSSPDRAGRVTRSIIGLQLRVIHAVKKIRSSFFR